MAFILDSLVQRTQDLKHNAQYDSIEALVLFVGYPRSGHTLIASILDSHPEMIIANEFNLLEKFQDFTKDPNEDVYSRRYRIFSELHSTSKRQTVSGCRAPSCRRSYTYNIPGSWQGKYKNQLKVKVYIYFIIIRIQKIGSEIIKKFFRNFTCTVEKLQ